MKEAAITLTILIGAPAAGLLFIAWLKYIIISHGNDSHNEDKVQ